jgi:hypothetical protein
MPDSFGKRQRDQVKARKAAARDERRVARSKRRKFGTQAEQPIEGVSLDASTPAVPNGDPPIPE